MKATTLLSKKNLHQIKVFVGQVVRKSAPVLKTLESIAHKWVRRFRAA